MQKPAGSLRFVLVPMMHVAMPEFYEGVRERLTTCDLIVTEGVTSRSLQATMITAGYRLIARRRFGLVRQNYATLLPEGVPEVNADSTAAEAMADLRATYGWIYPLLLAAIPLAHFFVAAFIGPRLYLQRQLSASLPADGDSDEQPLRADGDDPLTRSQARRNRRLFAELERIDVEHSGAQTSVGVVYGSEHIAEACAYLFTELGYRPDEPEWLTCMVSRSASEKCRSSRRS